MTGYSKEDADRLRAKGYRIVACFQCLVEHSPEPYWPYESVEFGGAQIYCKAHFDSVSLGKAVVKIGDWVGP